MDLGAMYAMTRESLLDLAGGLTDEQASAPLAATPPWTVVDGYRHLAGGCANLLDGDTEGAPSPAWTARHLADRADRSLAEVADEWATRGPQLDAVLAGAGGAMTFVELDAWTHGQDIRAAVGVGGDRDDPLLADLVDVALGAMGDFYTRAGGPALRLVIHGDGDRTLGEGEPSVTLTTSRYELLRIIFGRRSEAQIAAAGWEGDSGAAQTAIRIFDPPATDITD